MGPEEFDALFVGSWDRTARVMRIALPGVGDEAVTQAWSKAWRLGPEFDTEYDPSRWIRQQAWRDATRGKQTVPTIDVDGLEPHLVPVATALREMAPASRRATALSVVAGLGIDDVADEIETSPTKAQALLDSGTRTLTAALIPTRHGVTPTLAEALTELGDAWAGERPLVSEIRQHAPQRRTSHGATRAIIATVTVAALAVGTWAVVTHLPNPNEQVATASPTPSFTKATSTETGPAPLFEGGPRLGEGITCMQNWPTNLTPSSRSGAPTPGVVSIPMGKNHEGRMVVRRFIQNRPGVTGAARSPVRLEFWVGDGGAAAKVAELPPGVTGSPVGFSPDRRLLVMQTWDDTKTGAFVSVDTATGEVKELAPNAIPGLGKAAVIGSTLYWFGFSKPDQALLASVPLAGGQLTSIPLFTYGQPFGFAMGKLVVMREDKSWALVDPATGTVEAHPEWQYTAMQAGTAFLTPNSNGFALSSGGLSPAFFTVGKPVRSQAFPSSTGVQPSGGEEGLYVVAASQWTGIYDPVTGKLMARPRSSNSTFVLMLSDFGLTEWTTIPASGSSEWILFPLTDVATAVSQCR